MTDTDPVLAALSARIGGPDAEALLAKFRRYSNMPNVVVGVAKMPSSPETESAALALVEDPALADPLGTVVVSLEGEDQTEEGVRTRQLLRTIAQPGTPATTEYFWGLLTLAARADLGVLDRLDEHLAAPEYAQRLIAKIRRAAVKHAKAPAAQPSEASAPSATEVPLKTSQVKAWLAANPNVDPGVLAPSPNQKVAARSAAIRALAGIGTPRAFEVLVEYAGDADEEINKAWSQFDRWEFAAAMFRPKDGVLALGYGPSLEGIGAVAGIRELGFVFSRVADLSPLAECTDLRTVKVTCAGSGLAHVEALTKLPELTRLQLWGPGIKDADLSSLAECGIQHLSIDLNDASGAFLLEMAKLEEVEFLFEEIADPDPEMIDIALALVHKGVRVSAVLATFRKCRLTGLQERAEADPGITVEEGSKLVLTRA